MKARTILEVVPPSKMTSRKYQDKVIDKLASAINGMSGVEALNVPEILDENRLGQPFFKNVDACYFGRELYRRTGKKIIINKVVVQCPGTEGFKRWLHETIGDYEITRFIFVGGNFSGIKYPGPSVIEANLKAKKFPELEIGNIMIPSRRDEALNLLKKTRGGATFFTTQLIFEPDRIKSALLEYDRLCTKNDLEPGDVYLSFAPVAKAGEINFIKWLGAEVPAETEKWLLAEKGKVLEKSIALASDIWRDVNAFARRNSFTFTLGLNVEEIFLHNLDACLELAAELSSTGWNATSRAAQNS